MNEDIIKAILESPVVQAFLNNLTTIIVTIVGGGAIGGGFISGYYKKKASKKDKGKERPKDEKISTSEDDEEPLLIYNKAHTDISELIRFCETVDYGVKNTGRKLIAKTFLVNKLEGWREPAMEFAKKIDDMGKGDDCCSKASESELVYRHAMEMFEDGMEYEKLYFMEDGSLEDRECMAIFRNKFMEFHQDRVERFKKKVHDVCYDRNTYRTCFQKGSRILEALEDALHDTVQEARYTAAFLNGELDGKKYKGYNLTLPHHDNKHT